jgi:hypothetical protein
MSDISAKELLLFSSRLAKGEQVDNDMKAALESNLSEIVRQKKYWMLSEVLETLVQEQTMQDTDAILSKIFDVQSVGANTQYIAYKSPENTLTPYEARPGGNVPASELNVAPTETTIKNLQIETFIGYDDIARNGWKSVALATEYASAAFKNQIFSHIFTEIEFGLVAGSNVITAAGVYASDAEMAELATFASQFAQGCIFARKKYITNALMQPSARYRDMNEKSYAGVPLLYDAPTTQGDPYLLPDKRMYAIAGKLGSIGGLKNLNTYQEDDITKERLHLKFSGYTYSYAYYDKSFGNVEKLILQ